MSVEVKAQNTLSMTSVKAIKDATDEANSLLDSMRQSAIDAGTTLDGIYQDAMDAQTSADKAQASADSASEYASRAYANLSTVQNITETLTWIAQHGTMTLTSDVALDPTHIYFVVDAQGDYVVNGTHYAVVTEPDIADISTYYELSIDESLNNYVATHLAVDSEGLWIIPDAGGNKVLIATGSGSTYTTAGTYIIGKVDGVDVILAQFLGSGVKLGQDDTTSLSLSLDGIYGTGVDGTKYFEFSNSGAVMPTDRSVSIGTKTYSSTTITLDDTTLVVKSQDISGFASSGTVCHVSGSRCLVTLIGTTLTSMASTTSNCRVLEQSDNKSFLIALDSHDITIGTSDTFIATAEVPVMAGGVIIVTVRMIYNADNNHMQTNARAKRTGSSSFSVKGKIDGRTIECTVVAEAPYMIFGSRSFDDVPGGLSSTLGASLYGTGDYQTVLGKYNIQDSNDDYALIIGNGTSNSARSNALTVDWSGNVNIPSGAKYKINGSNLSASDVGAIALSDLNDYIVAQSESAETSIGTGTWRWREWNSGKVEIWYRGSANLDQTTNAGGLYRRYKRVVFPNSYALYKCSCIVNGTATGGWLNCGGLFNASGQAVDPVTQLEIMAYRISSSPDANQTNVNIYICGEK